ncbi:hypothetical protein ACGFYP_12300 [Streptomyces sp. NPDC048370]|uniref:hypothetical protein n=1 Tax=Streptomyces sp. NPDC048370 TaxID=3365540 RepID=UPI003723A7B7
MSPAGRQITERLSDEALSGATGRDRAARFALLDAWDASGRGHTAIARHLVDAHGVSGWHARSITVGYEQERGLRQVGQASDGRRQVSASRTVDVSPLEPGTRARSNPRLDPLDPLDPETWAGSNPGRKHPYSPGPASTFRPTLPLHRLLPHRQLRTNSVLLGSRSARPRRRPVRRVHTHHPLE